MRSELRAVRTGGVATVVDLTEECADFVRGEGDGLLQVFVPHATAGVAGVAPGRMPASPRPPPPPRPRPSGCSRATPRPTSRCPTPTAGRSPSPSTAAAG